MPLCAMCAKFIFPSVFGFVRVPSGSIEDGLHRDTPPLIRNINHIFGPRVINNHTKVHEFGALFLRLSLLTCVRDGPGAIENTPLQRNAPPLILRTSNINHIAIWVLNLKRSGWCLVWVNAHPASLCHPAIISRHSLQVSCKYLQGHQQSHQSA